MPRHKSAMPVKPAMPALYRPGVVARREIRKYEKTQPPTTQTPSLEELMDRLLMRITLDEAFPRLVAQGTNKGTNQIG